VDTEQEPTVPPRKLTTTMNADDFEQRLQRLPLRAPPAVWRDEILAAAGAPVSDPARSEPISDISTSRGGARRSVPAWWLAWLRPTRAGWAALGAVWLVIVALHFAAGDGSPAAHGPGVAASPQQWRERQRLMAELIEPTEPAPPRPTTRPRSERRVHPLFHHA
jgi:hypothetical protein